MNKKKIVKKVLNNEYKYVSLCQEELINILFGSQDIVKIMSSIREIIKRTTNLTLYPVQMLGALELAEGNIIEMKTGEGKTVVALAASLILIAKKKKVHIVTVNEYLADRDTSFSQSTLEYIGKKCCAVFAHTNNKKEIYESVDLIYITNHELGFDYLRSNSAYSLENVVFNNKNTFAIIDEADSVLIDEAKIPLILSVPKNIELEDYKKAQRFVISLNKDDYTIEAKDRRAFLNPSGVKKCEKYFNLNNYSDSKSGIVRHLIDQALIANFILKKDVDYIVKDDKIVLIDLNTGRIADGRRFNKGLHQALEAKENKEIKPESATIGSITYQKLFGLYENFGGMTGTIMNEKSELKDIYNKKPILIPTNKPIIRKDEKDLFFVDNKNRDQYLLNLVEKIHSTGRPILIGTSSIVESERIAKLLSKYDFNLLNAKNDAKEAEIIAKAGNKDSITIATNMAGRGTDIKLGEGVKELGGLALIGIGHYDFLRIDEQFRGRAGRQGDPGSSIFLVSLEDELLKTFAGDSLKKLIISLISDSETNYIYNKGLDKGIRKTQNAIATSYFNTRKSTVEYDNILEIYRTIFYSNRFNILTNEDSIKKLLPENLDLSNIDLKTTTNLALNIMDNHWIEFLNLANDLKSEAKYNSYSGESPIVNYERVLSEEYKKMIESIKMSLKRLAEQG